MTFDNNDYSRICVLYNVIITCVFTVCCLLARRFYYANVAPQWQEFNGDRWAELEKSYREALGKDKDIHLVVTGTYGSCMLPDVNDIEQSLFLDPPKNIPVPLFYWKIMYDLFENKGIVFLGMNNPYKEVDQSMFICENECVGGYKSKLNNSRNENDSNIFCCSIESFEKVYGKLDPIIFEKIN